MKSQQIPRLPGTGMKSAGGNNHLSINRHIAQARQAERIMHEVPMPDETLVKRLNELARKLPFCAYHKDKKHDPL